jgi:hypothetical protein
MKRGAFICRIVAYAHFGAALAILLMIYGPYTPYHYVRFPAGVWAYIGKMAGIALILTILFLLGIGLPFCRRLPVWRRFMAVLMTVAYVVAWGSVDRWLILAR